jgi:hypothetical protein
MQQSMQFLLSQHVSSTNMPIIRSTINGYLPLLGGHAWKFALVVLHWAYCQEEEEQEEQSIEDCGWACCV